MQILYVQNDYKKPFAVSTTPMLNGLLEKGFKIVKENNIDHILMVRKLFLEFWYRE